MFANLLDYTDTLTSLLTSMLGLKTQLQTPRCPVNIAVMPDSQSIGHLNMLAVLLSFGALPQRTHSFTVLVNIKPCMPKPASRGQQGVASYMPKATLKNVNKA